MILTDEQKRTLRKTLEAKIVNPNLSKLQKTNFNNILNKLDSDNFRLLKEEVICLTELAHDLFIRFSKQYPRNESIFWVNVPFPAKVIMEEKDVLLELLSNSKREYIPKSFGYNLDFRSKSILEKIEKLKKSDTILLSSKSDPYKIAFVYHLSEVIMFDLKTTINIENEIFNTINDYGGLVNSFFEKLTRQEAFDIISNCDIKKYLKDNIEFLLEVLK